MGVSVLAKNSTLPIIRVLPSNSSVSANVLEISDEAQAALHSTSVIQPINETTQSDNQYTNNFASIRKPLELERNVLVNQASLDITRRKEYIEENSKQLTKLFSLYNYDEESENLFWPYVDKITLESSVATLGDILQDIIIKMADYPNVLCAIAKCLCSFDLSETYPWGYFTLIPLLGHRSDQVKEYGIMLLENWESPTLLPLLRNFECSSQWLREYLYNVIKRLEG